MPSPPPTLTLLAVVGLASLQGPPRRGTLHLGIPLGGALDLDRLRAANRAIENVDDAVAIELCGTLTLRVIRSAGEPGATDRLVISIDGSLYTLRPGETLTVPGDQPVRYIALPGGAWSPTATGRFGTLPGDRLHAGDLVHAGSAPQARLGLLEPTRLSAARLSVTRGPDRFPDEAWCTLLHTTWRVTSSSRAGTRLSGPSIAAPPVRDSAGAPRPAGNRGSKPMLTGFIEVPPDGQPIVLGPDHPVTGGYPVIGALHAPLGARSAGESFQFTDAGPPLHPAVPLNIDLGELPDEDPALHELADIANIACGGHAGDDASMRRTLLGVAAHRGRVAAHPSYPDRANFGRVDMSLPPSQIEATVREQCAALRAIADRVGVDVFAVKPHGALYHAAIRDPAIAEAIRRGARAALTGDVVFIGLPGGWVEGFADRGVLPDGRLIPRGQPGALLTDPVAVARRAAELAAPGPRAVDTICVHGDTPGAVQLARAARDAIHRCSAAPLPPAVRFHHIALPHAADRAALYALWSSTPGVEDIAFGDDSALVVTPHGPVNLPSPADLARAADVPSPAPRHVGPEEGARFGTEHRIEVRYDGVDLQAVAQATRLSVEQVINHHLGPLYTVAYPGFSPGFAYLDGLPEALVMPRRATPRPAVPPGSVAIAEARTAIYPTASPGGWHLLGQTNVQLFDPQAGPLLRTGDRVRFVRIG